MEKFCSDFGWPFGDRLKYVCIQGQVFVVCEDVFLLTGIDSNHPIRRRRKRSKRLEEKLLNIRRRMFHIAHRVSTVRENPWIYDAKFPHFFLVLTRRLASVPAQTKSTEYPRCQLAPWSSRHLCFATQDAHTGCEVLVSCEQAKS